MVSTAHVFSLDRGFTISHQLSEVLVDVDLVPIVVVDGGQPEVEQVVVVVQRAQLKEGDGGAIVVVAISLLILKSCQIIKFLLKRRLGWIPCVTTLTYHVSDETL